MVSRAKFLFLLFIVISSSSDGASSIDDKIGKSFLERDYHAFELLYLKASNKDYFSHSSGVIVGYIDFSIAYKDERFFQLVVQYGDPNFPDDMDFTPIFTAAMNCKFDKVEKLVERGARINYLSFSQGASPLHMAVLAGCHDVADYFVNLGAQNISGNDDLPTPLELAIEQGDEQMIAIVQAAVKNGLGKR